MVSSRQNFQCDIDNYYNNINYLFLRCGNVMLSLTSRPPRHQPQEEQPAA